MNRKYLTDAITNIEYILTDNQAKIAVVLFHGYGANMQDLWGLCELIEGHKDYDWIFPNGTISLSNMMPNARAWFPIDIQELELAMAQGRHRTYADKYPSEFADILKTTEAFIQNLAKSYDSIIIGGFSQGSMLATHLCLTKSIEAKALICFSSTLIGEKELLRATSHNEKLPVFQSHGKHDPILSYADALRLKQFFDEHNYPVEFIAFNGGHEIPFEVINGWNKFMQKLSC